MFCLLAQVNIRHTRMQTSFCSSSHCSNTKRRESGGGEAIPQQKAALKACSRGRKLHQNEHSAQSFPSQGQQLISPCVACDIKKIQKSPYKPRYPKLQNMTRPSLAVVLSQSHQKYKTPYQYIQIHIIIVNMPENIALFSLTLRFGLRVNM